MWFPIIYLTDIDDSSNKNRQAGADVGVASEMTGDFGVSFANALIGDEVLEKHVADPAFMRQENWATELASRVYKAMVKQAVHEGRLAILKALESPRTYRRRSLGFGPRSAHCSEIPGTVAP